MNSSKNHNRINNMNRNDNFFKNVNTADINNTNNLAKNFNNSNININMDNNQIQGRKPMSRVERNTKPKPEPVNQINYKVILQKIKSARQTSVINLSNLNLEYLPKEIFDETIKFDDVNWWE